MLMQEMEYCDTEEDIDVDGISTDSDKTQVKMNRWACKVPVETHIHKLLKLYMK